MVYKMESSTISRPIRPMRPKESQLIDPKLSCLRPRRLLASHVRPKGEPLLGTRNMPFLRNEGCFLGFASQASQASYVSVLTAYRMRDYKSIDLNRDYMGRLGRLATSPMARVIVPVIIALLVAWLWMSRQSRLQRPADAILILPRFLATRSAARNRSSLLRHHLPVHSLACRGAAAHADAHTIPHNVAAHAGAHAVAHDADDHTAIAVCVSPASRGCVNWSQLYRPVASQISNLVRSNLGNARFHETTTLVQGVSQHARVLPGAYPLTGQRIARPGHIIELYHDLTAPFLRIK